MVKCGKGVVHRVDNTATQSCPDRHKKLTDPVNMLYGNRNRSEQRERKKKKGFSRERYHVSRRERVERCPKTPSDIKVNRS